MCVFHYKLIEHTFSPIIITMNKTMRTTITAGLVQSDSGTTNETAPEIIKPDDAGKVRFKTVERNMQISEKIPTNSMNINTEFHSKHLLPMDRLLPVVAGSSICENFHSIWNPSLVRRLLSRIL